jgi:dihydroflavonol-4-reductase
MDRVLVTGATGLIGANVCDLLTGAGVGVNALVRPGSETGPLEAMGCTLCEGDVRDEDSVRRAAAGTDGIVHAAALLGGRTQDAAASYETNYLGSVHCYDAGRDIRVVEMATTTFLHHEEPLTETSAPLDPDQVPDDPYSRTKAEAFVEARRRVEAGQDIVVVIPGGTLGPSPVPQRSLGHTSYNRLVRGAVNGRLTEYLHYPVPWVRARDVAAAVVASLSAGAPGDVFLAFGAEDASAGADLLNLACELAGVEHRIRDLVARPDDPAIATRYGDTLALLATKQWPTPWFDNATTRRVLDYRPVSLHDTVAETVEWLRSIGQIA